jgi:hypothetical protein
MGIDSPFSRCDRQNRSLVRQQARGSIRTKPVIDAMVLKNLGLRLPRIGAADRRLARAVDVYNRIGQVFFDYLETDMGRHLIARFDESYPNRRLTQIKMVDLILWQVR